jgi:hypothetical protein
VQYSKPWGWDEHHKAKNFNLHRIPRTLPDNAPDLSKKSPVKIFVKFTIFETVGAIILMKENT